MDLTGKTALITGGARIGRVVAEVLARRGAAVALTYQSSRDAAEATVRDVEAQGGRGLAIPADLRRDEDAARAVAATVQAFGRLDVVVALASLYRAVPLAEAVTADFEAHWNVDVLASWRVARCAEPHLRQSGAGRVVFVSDWTVAGGRPRYKDYLPYYVAKSGVKALAEGLALDWAPTILVNAVAPGPILPPPDLSPESDREVMKHTPLGRWGGPAEVAKAVLFFIESDFVTGECLRVDGGRHLY